jgi:hypothetical protein
VCRSATIHMRTAKTALGALARDIRLRVPDE